MVDWGSESDINKPAEVTPRSRLPAARSAGRPVFGKRFNGGRDGSGRAEACFEHVADVLPSSAGAEQQIPDRPRFLAAMVAGAAS